MLITTSGHLRVNILHAFSPGNSFVSWLFLRFTKGNILILIYCDSLKYKTKLNFQINVQSSVNPFVPKISKFLFVTNITHSFKSQSLEFNVLTGNFIVHKN